ncbi:MAG: ATP-dependent Clp protease proteolytic subunit [Lachnospiraceae bacterium]|nr:ATP-dependent Clp protease proteolytic subunit [Lachnospiraceae bacterium]
MAQQNEEKKENHDELDNKKYKDEKIEKESQVTLDENNSNHKIHLITIVGEIEGHENAGNQSKVTKYELLLPQLASIEDSDEIDGVLLLLNTMGGDVEAGLAIAEMVASLSKPTVSLVLGGSHSIGVPIAVSTDYSFIVPTGTMVVHPVRMNGMVIGVPQTFNYFRDVQNRITGFVCTHCGISKERYEELMMETEVLTKDVGSVLEGEEAVKEGIINEMGGISQAVAKLHELINNDSKKSSKKMK